MSHTITQKKPGFFRGVKSKFRNLFRKEKKIVLHPVVEHQSKNVDPAKCDKEVGYNVYQKLSEQFSKYFNKKDVESTTLYMFKMQMIGLLFRDYPELFADPSISGIERGAGNTLDEKREVIINRATERFNQIFKEDPYYDFGSIIKKWIDEANTSSSGGSKFLGGSRKSVRKQKQNKKHTRKSRK